MRDYAIIGAGKEAQALAKAFARKGIEVAIASRRQPTLSVSFCVTWGGATRSASSAGGARPVELMQN